MQHQRRNHHILQRNERALPKRAEWVPLPDVVGEGDEEGGGFEEVGEEGDTRCGLRVEEFEELWDLDYGTGADDADAETFAYCEFEAVRVVYGIEVEDQVLIADGPEEVVAQLVEGGGQVVPALRISVEMGVNAVLVRT